MRTRTPTRSSPRSRSAIPRSRPCRRGGRASRPGRRRSATASAPSRDCRSRLTRDTPRPDRAPPSRLHLGPARPVRSARRARSGTYRAAARAAVAAERPAFRHRTARGGRRSRACPSAPAAHFHPAAAAARAGTESGRRRQGSPACASYAGRATRIASSRKDPKGPAGRGTRGATRRVARHDRCPPPRRPSSARVARRTGARPPSPPETRAVSRAGRSAAASPGRRASAQRQLHRPRTPADRREAGARD